MNRFFIVIAKWTCKINASWSLTCNEWKMNVNTHAFTLSMCAFGEALDTIWPIRWSLSYPLRYVSFAGGEQAGRREEQRNYGQRSCEQAEYFCNLELFWIQERRLIHVHCHKSTMLRTFGGYFSFLIVFLPFSSPFKNLWSLLLTAHILLIHNLIFIAILKSLKILLISCSPTLKTTKTVWVTWMWNACETKPF